MRLLSIGRMAARSGGQGQATAPYGWLGKLMCLLVLIAVCHMWWRPILCFAVAFVIVLGIVVACKMGGQRERGRS